MPEKNPQPRVPTNPRPAPRPRAVQPRPVPRAAAPRPVARPVPKPVAPVPVGGPRPARPVIVTTPRSSSGGGAAFFVAAMVVLIGGGLWYFAQLPKKSSAGVTAQTPVVVVQPIVKEAPSAPPPLPIAERAAEKVSSAPMTAQNPVGPGAPTPLPNVPVPPTPGETGPDPYKELLLLDAIAARSPAQVERSGKLLRMAMENDEWPKYLDLLKRSLTVELRKNPDFDSIQRYDRYTANPVFMRTMLQHAVGNLGGDSARRLIAENELVRQHMIWVCENHEIMESLLRAWTPADDFRRVIETWARLAADDGEAYGKYRELAIACALVFEKPKQFEFKDEKFSVTAEERYRWYKAKDKAGELVARITEMSAWQLAWVVGVPVPESEMEWALKEIARTLKQRDWGRAYGMVPYDMQKAVTGKMKDPYEYYTFAEILKKGGVCGDRAYFAANTARSAGIPALPVSGDGPRGPHAWITWMADDGKWKFSGRFDGYPAGTVRDPRNGNKMTEQKFVRLSDNQAPSDATMLRAQRLVWLHDLQDLVGQKAEAQQALEFAVKTSPRQSELWEKKIDAWSKLIPPPAPSVWKTFLDSLKREFRDDTDLLTVARQAEDQYVLAKVGAEMVKNELRSDIRDLGKLKGLTSLDEIRSAHKRYADLFLKTNDYPALRRIYREALDDYGREPAKFKALARDYWNFVQAAKPEIRLVACRDVEGAFERHVETRTGDYFDVQSQNSAAKVVAQLWREAGDEARAARFEKEIEKRGSRATKRAL